MRLTALLDRTRVRVPDLDYPTQTALRIREVCAGRITLSAARRARVYRIWRMLEAP